MRRRSLVLKFAALSLAALGCPPRTALAASAAAQARSAAAEREVLWNALRAGGIAMLLRHAQTVPGIGDPPGFRLKDCSTQRNLSDAGRRQAIEIGKSLTEQRVRFDAVLSSQWCRCLDTARLAFPDASVQELPALNSFFEDRSSQAQQTAALRRRVAVLQPPANVALITHQVNIVALTGQPVAAGEAVLVRPEGSAIEVLGRLAL